MNTLEANISQWEQLGLTTIAQDELSNVEGGVAPLVGYAIYAGCVGAGMLIGWALN